MWRALLLTSLLALPAAAQVNPAVNPYNPYVNLASHSPVNFRPYSSLDRWNVEHQSRTAPSTYFVTYGSSAAIANPARPAAAFRYYPNYPSLQQPLSTTYVAITSQQPLPFTAPQPVETSCDPYLDDDGCLSEIAGW